MKIGIGSGSTVNQVYGDRFWPIAEDLTVGEGETLLLRGLAIVRADVTVTVTGTLEVR